MIVQTLVTCYREFEYSASALGKDANSLRDFISALEKYLEYLENKEQ